jgi:CheY-like chemotaxis protein
MIHAKTLIVDDSDYALETLLDYLGWLSRKFEKAGLKLEILGAPSFDMAVRLLQEGSFDLIISDIYLDYAGGDGNDLIRKIRHGEYATPRDIPAIALTAHLPSVYPRIFEAGFNHILPKPCLPDEIVKAIFLSLELKPPPWFFLRHSPKVVARTERARQGPFQPSTIILEVLAEEVHLSALVLHRGELPTDKTPILRRINGEPYVGDSELFDLRFPVTLIVDDERLATFTAVKNEQFVVTVGVGEIIIPRLKTGSTLVIEYVSLLEGEGQSVRFPLAGISEALAEAGL